MWGEPDGELHGVFNRLLDASGARKIWGSPVSSGLQLYEDDWDDIGKHYSVHSDDEDSVTFPCLDDCLFEISEDLVRLCPTGTRVGDLMVVLLGGSVPYILRDTTSLGPRSIVVDLERVLANDSTDLKPLYNVFSKV